MLDSAVHYVYVIYRLTDAPCYVGKGKGRRLAAHRRRSHNMYLRRIMAAEGDTAKISKVAESLSNPLACELETFLIAEIGRKNKGRGPLVNFTDGGEGAVGRSPSPETRRLIGIRNSAARRGKKYGPHSEDRLRAISESRRGKKWSAKGRALRVAKQSGKGIPKSAEWRALMSAKKQEYWAAVRAADTPEYRAYRARNALQLQEARSAKRRASG